MQVVIDLEKDSVDELKRAVELLKQVISNKENGQHFATGLDKFSVEHPRSSIGKLSSPQAQKMLEQEKMMADMDISKILERKYKRRMY